MLRWVLTPIVLASAKRTGTDSVSVSPANSCEETSLSTQDMFAAVARAATGGATEVCFKVRRSLSYSQSTGLKFVGKLRSGEFECVQLKDQVESTQKALASLADGEVVKLRRSSDWVVCAEERNGAQVKDVTLRRPVTVMRVGAETSRTVKGTQEMTAKYHGSVRPTGALLLVASDVDPTTAENLACFRIRHAGDYKVSLSSDTPVGKLSNDEKICMRLEDLSVEARTLIGGLETDDPVNMSWVHEMVVYGWRNGDGATDSATEYDFNVTLQKRTKKSADELGA